MGEALRQTWISPDDYLAGEQTADIRHEYVDGEVFAMGGASRRHNEIIRRLVQAIGPVADRRKCSAYFTDVKVKVAAANAYYYPDFVVTCAPDDRDEYVVHAPCLIVEVLSPSTEAVDRREKRANYATIPSLQEYLLVYQEERRIDVWRRTPDGWRCDTYSDGAIDLISLDCPLALDEVYA